MGRSEMKKTIIILILCVSAIIIPSAYSDTPPKLDIIQIETLTGERGDLDKESGVFKVSVPRKDLKINAAGVHLTPGLGLTSWAAFKQIGSGTEVMGDIVLLEDQVNPVMKTALENGLKVTALHNHFFWDTPKVMFMHIEGMGEVQSLATAMGKVFKEIKNSSDRSGKPQLSEIIPADSTFDPKKIEAILGKKGNLKDGVYKIVWGRTSHMGGHEMGSVMGVNTWAAFAGTDKDAVMLGDFAMKEDEVQNVLKTLLKNNIEVVAIHQHMLSENPRIIFLHYWGRGNILDLTKGLKDALGQIKPSKT